MKETPEEVENHYREMLLALSPGERLAMACRMFATAKSLMIAGMSSTHGEPLSSELFLRLYGRDFGASQREKILKHFVKKQDALFSKAR